MILTEDLIALSKTERQQHLALGEPCVERGGNSTNHKGVLAQYLDTDIPKGYRVLLCHACNNGKCSNPKHLYWGSPKDNTEDAIIQGTRSNFFEARLKKHGADEVAKMNTASASKMNAALKQTGYAHLKRPKSEEHKRKIAESLRRRREISKD